MTGSSNTYYIQAEHMSDYGFKTTWGRNASNDKFVKLSGHEGKLWKTFDGQSGTYEFKIKVQDENDGQSTLRIKIDGEVVGTITLDKDNNGGGSDNGYFTSHSLNGIEIPNGAKIEIEARCDGGEYVRIDKIELKRTGDIPTSDDSGSDGGDGGDGGGEVCLLHEKFNDSHGYVENDFKHYYGGVKTYGGRDGALELKAVSLDGFTNAKLTFQAVVLNGGFEASGSGADEFAVYIVTETGEEILLDVFRGNGNVLIGSITGQRLDTSLDTLTYDLPEGITSASVRFESDISYCTEIIWIDNVKICAEEGDTPPPPPPPPPGTAPDCELFDQTADGTQLKAGDGGVLAMSGVTFTAIRAQDMASNGGDGLYNDAMIFDSGNPTGGDWDLAHNDLGNILIISEDGDSSDPDDNAIGGQIVAELDVPSTVHEVMVLDTETKNGATIDLFDENGVLLASFPVPQITDGGRQVVGLGDTEGVKTVVFNFKSSGAIDKFCFTPDDAPTLGSISGRYFCDKNGNSLDDDEPGVAGREVKLLTAGLDGVFGTGDDVIEATTSTDDTGGYSFGDLDAGEYAVMIDGERYVTQDVDGNASDDIDSDVDGSGMTGAITVAAGEDVTDIDAGTACFEVPADGRIGATSLISASGGARLDAIDNQGTTAYDAITDTFTMSAAASQIYTMADGLPALTGSGLHGIRVELNIEVDGNGDLVDGASSTSTTGFTGFLVWEDADDNGSFDDSIDTIILAGDVLALGAENSTDTPTGQTPTVNDIDNYDVLVEVTGGTLAPKFDAIIGMGWSSEASSFDDSFQVDFAGEAKAVIGDVDIDCVCV
ncbi:hypothetical protein LNKW23_23020 [Paralimibaculum aggregatum]|uniref:SD-repeat containing protein B domain-containing protein n=1 Tax=Paralimibaculum aggregatum TaxID=3036245 RepID=A0ABQ6LII2_9RHOB|nr:SdrD B-like domain-containing protein [Limibaculum sp. NKW23]GMG83089.1 hypothetical protein LNKW23_23020 [Limibaculum sp. NKW23]